MASRCPARNENQKVLFKNYFPEKISKIISWVDNTETLVKGMSQDTLLETVKKTHRLIPITNLFQNHPIFMEHFTLTDSICTKKNGVSSSLLLFAEQISSIYREDCSNSLTHLVFLEHFMFVCLILHFKKVGKKREIINQI